MPCKNPPCCPEGTVYLLEFTYDWNFTGYYRIPPRFQLFFGEPGLIFGETRQPLCAQADNNIMGADQTTYMLKYYEDGDGNTIFALAPKLAQWIDMGAFYKDYVVTWNLGVLTEYPTLSELDLTGITPQYTYEPDKEGHVPIVTGFTVTALTMEEAIAMRNNCDPCKEIYGGDFINAFGYDPRSVDPPPWECCIIYTYDNGSTNESLPIVPSYWYHEGGGIGDDQPLGWYWGFLYMFLVDGEVILYVPHILGGGDSINPINLGTPWIGPLSLPLVDGYHSLDEWEGSEDCLAASADNCHGAYLPAYLLVRVPKFCGEMDYPAEVCLHRDGDACHYISDTLYHGETDYTVSAVVGSDLKITFTSSLYFGVSYQFVYQLLEENYTGRTITVLNGIGENNTATRYVPRITAMFLPTPGCRDLSEPDEDDCPICVSGSEKTLCITVSLVFVGDEPGTFHKSYLQRSAQCTWAGVYADCLEESPAEYSVTLTAVLDGCMATITARVTQTSAGDHNGEWVEYARTYNVKNAETDCHASYYMAESARSATGALPDLSNVLHIFGGDDEDCPDQSVPGDDYNWPETMIVFFPDTDPGDRVVNLVYSDDTTAIYSDGPWQVYCLDDPGTDYTFEFWQITLEKIMDPCPKLQVTINFPLASGQTPPDEGCGLGDYTTPDESGDWALQHTQVFAIDDFLCHPETFWMEHGSFKIYVNYTLTECKTTP